MKKQYRAASIVLALAIIVGLFTACAQEAAPVTKPSDPSTSEITEPVVQTEPVTTLPSTEESTETTVPDTEETTEESETETEIDLPIEDPIKVMYCSYTEKPYFAMVGTCNEGAVVVATINGTGYSSQSYRGWFSLRLPCEGSSVEVTLTQTLNGRTFDEPISYTAWPKTPDGGRWPMVTGKNFQFFLQKMLPDYQHDNLDSQEVYDNFRLRIEERLQTIHAYNPDAEIIYLIVPSAMTVYPELVPVEYTQGTGKSRLDMVIETINQAGATAIDLQEVFEDHKYDEMPLYYKLDSHWADYGAFIAYQALFDHISEKFPEATPRDLDEFYWNEGYYQSGDMTYYLGMPQSQVLEYAYYRTFDFEAPSAITRIPRYRYENMLFYSENVTWEHRIKTDRPELPSCIVIRDSYSTQIFDLIPERMDTTHYLGMWNYSWDNYTIKQEEPDYIIYLVAEWNIDALLK